MMGRRLIAGILMAAVLAPAGSHAADALTTYECRGNEPFWSLEASEKRAVLGRPGTRGAQKSLFSGSLHPMTYLRPPLSVWRGDGETGTLVAIIEETACTDTMTDGPARPYRVIVSAPGLEAVQGCCARTQVLVHQPDARITPAGDWSKRITEYLPAIGACVLDSGLAVERIDLAWPMNKGLIGVRLRDAAGNRHDCLAESGGGAIVGVEALSETTAHMKGEANPVFYPAREQPPLVEVGRIEQVVSRDGVFQGWLHYPPRPLAPVPDIVGEWMLEDIDGKGVIDNLNTPFIITADSKVNGHAGCNRFFGKAEITGGLISVGPTMTTKMACPPAIMEQEQRFFRALDKIERWERENGLLLLKDGAGETLLRFAPAG